MSEAIRDKQTMYRLLAEGRLGNTCPQHFDIHSWVRSGDADRYPFWGVRTLKPGGPCRLNCPTAEVMSTVFEFAQPCNISPMIDKFCTVTAWLEVWDSPTGLVVEGIEYPDTKGGWTWRNSMPDPAKRKHWEGVQARLILRKHLNANSYEDVCDLMEQYPDHIIEFSTTDRNIGTVPHRNHVVWECRQY